MINWIVLAEQLSDEYPFARVSVIFQVAGHEIRIFSRVPNCFFKSHLQLLCIETRTSLGSLLKFEEAAG